MASPRTYRVAEVAAIASVTVRTLHHYDAIGLLTPSGRSRAGYRLYTDRDLFRLQQILIQRELGLALEDVRRALDDQSFDLRQALTAQRSALERRIEDSNAMLRSVNAALSALDPDLPPPPTHPESTPMQHLFQGFDPSKYEEETLTRWGNTDAYAESKRRTVRYSAEDWQRYKTEQDEVYQHLASLLAAGLPASSEPAQAAVERHRLLIDRWFYPCPREMHLNLASLYEGDSRFSDNIDEVAPGLARFLVAAIRREGHSG